MSYKDKILQELDNMPSLPITVSKVLEIARDPYSSPIDLNKVISLDPILTVKVLRLVNSAYYSLSVKVTSIVKAIILLGVNTIRNLALSTAVIPLVGTRVNKKWIAISVEDYWRHSIGTGVTAKLIAKKVGVEQIILDEFFIGGLLHDIGKVVLINSFPEEYQQVIDMAEQNSISLLSAENEVMGINHIGAGLILAEKWELPADTKEVIEFHHDPKLCESENKQLVFSIAIANGFCVEHGIGFSGDQYTTLNTELLSLLNLKENDMESWTDSIIKEIDNASIFMNIQ